MKWFRRRPLKDVVLDELYATSRELIEAHLNAEAWKSRRDMLEGRERRLAKQIAELEARDGTEPKPQA